MANSYATRQKNAQNGQIQISYSRAVCSLTDSKHADAALYFILEFILLSR